jgi:hypothetical protein
LGVDGGGTGGNTLSGALAGLQFANDIDIARVAGRGVDQQIPRSTLVDDPKATLSRMQSREICARKSELG